jgi:putative DNA primase/helicase
MSTSQIPDDHGLIVSAVRYEAPVGKPYGYKNGKVVHGKSYRSEKAVGETMCFKSFDEFVLWRMPLVTEYMLVSGSFDAIGEVTVVYKDKEGDGTVSASKKYLAHRKQAGILIIDIDFKDETEVAGLFPAGVKPYASHEAALDDLSKVLPEADDCGLLIGWSTSSNLFIENELVKGTGGIRIYVPVTDASNIPELLETIHKRCWLHGLGWAFIDGGAGFQERSLVDQALARPAQPDYAAPDLQDNLVQERHWTEFEGDWLEPDSVHPLTPEEEVTYQAAVRTAKAALSDDMKRQKEAAKKAKADKLVSQGVNRARARKIADRLYDHGVVTGEDQIVFDDGEVVTAATLVTDGEKYDEQVCYDPVEPDYDGGRAVGKLYWNDGMRPMVHSFAHGGRVYHLRHDLDSLKVVLETGERDAIVEAMARAELSSLEMEEAEAVAARVLGLGNRRRSLRQEVEAEIQRSVEYGRDEVEEVGVGRLNLDPDTPLTSARRFIQEHHTVDGTRILHFQSGDFYHWNDNHYSEVDENTIRARIYEFVDGAETPNNTPFNPDAAKVSNVQDALRALTNLDSSVKTPTWLNGSDDPPEGELVACTNGLLHLPTRRLIPATPDFYTHNALDYAYDSDACQPIEWLNFLNEVWGDDPESIKTLQELFGYALTQDTRQQKIFAIVGPKRSGKGTIGRVLTSVVGNNNVANPTLASISTQFGLQALINKQLAIISDARLSAKVDQSQITERLLAISGEDGQTIDRKYKSAWSGWLHTRFIILTNELPRLSDVSGALASRFIILRMTETFYGREDLDLTNRLLNELPGILNWSLDGWQRLQERGHFIQPKTAAEDIEALEDLASPIGAFIKDRCEVGTAFEVRADEIYSAWCGWCQREGRHFPGTKQTFGRDLKAALPHIRIVQKRDESGVRQRVYHGVGLVSATKIVFGPARVGTRT